MGFEYTPEQIVPRKSLAEKGRKLHEEFKSLDLDKKSFREFLLDRGFTEKRARKILVAMQQDEEEVFEPIEEFFQEEIPAEEVAEILGAKSALSGVCLFGKGRMDNNSDIKWIEKSPVDSYDLILRKEDAFYKLGDLGTEMSSSREIDGNTVFVNHKREVVAVWYEDEQRLAIYVWSKRQKYQTLGNVFGAIGFIIILLIVVDIVDKIGFNTIWLLAIVIFCPIAFYAIIKDKFFKKK